MDSEESADLNAPVVRAKHPQTIGVFDSGVGGLTVVREVRRAFPAHDIIYLGDTARVPYGSKSPQTVERYARACQDFLLSKGAEVTLIACNTASATAITALRSSTQTPVIGAVIPGAKAALAATKNNSIGVIGTLATVQSGAYERAILALNSDASVTTLACPLLVPLAEEGWLDDDIALAVSKRYLAELNRQAPSIDTLVLGCTHYPLLREALSSVSSALWKHPLALVDSASAMTHCLRENLSYDSKKDAKIGALRIYVTDATRIDVLGTQFLGEKISQFHLVDL